MAKSPKKKPRKRRGQQVTANPTAGKAGSPKPKAAASAAQKASAKPTPPAAEKVTSKPTTSAGSGNAAAASSPRPAPKKARAKTPANQGLTLNLEPPLIWGAIAITVIFVAVMTVSLSSINRLNADIREATQMNLNGQYDQALVAFTQIARSNPNNGTVQQTLGHLKLRKATEGEEPDLELLKEAVSHYSKVLFLYSTDVTARQGMIQCYLASYHHHRKEAARFRELAARNENSNSTLQQQENARLLNAAQRLDEQATKLINESHRVARKALSFNRDSMLTVLYLGRIELLRGNYVKAAEWFSAVVYDEHFGPEAREYLEQIKAKYAT
jgi:tetratricopeptide (TPR) repeat protein